MKQNGKAPDVDFIGGGRALTKEDEKAISDFLQARKQKKAKNRPAFFPQKCQKNGLGKNLNLLNISTQ